jgi:ATP-dependent Clp protease ATP-binding subunit ClpB
VLFDEIEKAHHDVFNVLLQILDDGRLTDGQGRTVDFKNTVVIMTSNIGSTAILDAGQGEDAQERMRDKLLEALRQFFRPEFLNRVDEIVVFHSLDRSHLREIVMIQLERLYKRLADRRIDLRLTEAAKDYLAERGFDPVYGARPLKRAIQRDLETPLSRAIVGGTVRDDSVVEVDAGDGGLSFSTRPHEPESESVGA